MRTNKSYPILLALGLLFCGQVPAAVAPEQAAKLGGPELTPVGAQRAGTDDGRIPAWTGDNPELMARVDKLKPGAFYPILFPSDKPLLRIDHNNYEKYADHLPAGAVAMLKRYKDYHLNVYPTRRTAVFPDAIYKATKANATTAHLDGVDKLEGAKVGFPFPIPTSGAQVIWNHKVRFRGNSIKQTSNIITVNQDGKFETSGFEQTVKFFYGNTNGTAKKAPGVIMKMMRKVVSPPRNAGRYTLVIDKLQGGRDAWIYMPGNNRLMQAPTIHFDSPIQGADGLIFADQSDMFNGSMRLYNWKLLGKKLMYIPYNDYALEQPDLTYDQLIQAHHLNPEYLRYELHRVWVVEASLRKGTRNQISRRVFYVDEDSWTIAAVDCYDTRGNLWRYEEGFIFPLLKSKAVVAAPTVFYDLSSGRYAVQNLVNEEPYLVKTGVSIPRAFFTPQHMKRLGSN